MSQGLSSLDHNLSHHTSFFGIKLWIFIVACILAIAVLVLVLLSLYFIYCRHRKPPRVHINSLRPVISKNSGLARSLDKRLLSRNGAEIELSIETPEKRSELTGLRCGRAVSVRKREKHGYAYALREIEAATNGFADVNVIGSGDFGIVYHGVLFDGTRVAIKKLLYDRCKDENFIAQVEAIGNVRHKNLVKLLGYCTEGAFRMLVYEYVDNGNLSQWLHGCIRQVSPLTWNMRINVIQAVGKGLAYLHEDIEPKIVHQQIKSSNILLDQQWNPKISDIGIAKVLCPEWSHVATSPMGMSGYIAPEYAYTGVFNEKTDVYSFGILLMEIITGRTPVEGNETEVYLIDWLKCMVANQSFDQVVDPKMPEMPSVKELKRIVLVALRCVDPDVENRPRMGDVIHMLEPRDLLLSDESCASHKTSRCNSLKDNQAFAKQVEGVKGRN
ncbi:probable serine/threonine-protein kinase At1g01540 [Actinidia eriantha]|uniref:probable serine/threonine-protein kinase At1g01540 n=1 Tax=Actinidia eriantha TaxID=165200 RepID=UPI00258736ED|nr:probable serine/threonine-protein kinase At1g01540 [Actinidia eriantha]